MWHLSKSKCSWHENLLSGGTSEQVAGVVAVVSGTAVAAVHTVSQAKQVVQQNPCIHGSPHLSSCSSSPHVYHQSGEISSQVPTVTAGTACTWGTGRRRRWRERTMGTQRVLRKDEKDMVIAICFEFPVPNLPVFFSDTKRSTCVFFWYPSSGIRAPVSKLRYPSWGKAEATRPANQQEERRV